MFGKTLPLEAPRNQACVYSMERLAPMEHSRLASGRPPGFPEDASSHGRSSALCICHTAKFTQKLYSPRLTPNRLPCLPQPLRDFAFFLACGLLIDGRDASGG